MTKSFRRLWDRFLFRDRGIVPTPRLLWCLAALSLGLFLISFGNLSWLEILYSYAVLLALSLLDLRFMPGKKELSFHRIIKEELERGVDYTVDLEVSNQSRHPVLFRLIDGLPQSFLRPFPVVGQLPEQKKFSVQYVTNASARGDYELSKLYFRYRSRIGLWERQVTVHLTDQVRVIPDMTEAKQYLGNAQKFLLYEGLHIRKGRVGSGEFSKIRKYVVGDDLRKINWRQTAKMQDIMMNEYEPEHGKYITILMDCGRMMGVELEDRNRLERSLEAALTVAAAALQKGDYVSFLAFSKRVQVYVPAAKGLAHLQTILHEIYNLKVDSYESDYAGVFQYLQTVQKKRSLILLFSDVSTCLNEEAALFYLQRLQRKHVFLVLGIKDQTTVMWTKQAPDTLQNTMIKSMAQRHVLDKNRELTKWKKKGLHMQEAPEERLATTAVTQYIDMMNRELL